MASTVGTREALRADLKANRGHTRGEIVVVMFRVTKALRSSRFSVGRLGGRVASAAYRVLVEWVFGIEIPWMTEIGPGLTIRHGTGIVVNGNAVFGKDVVIRQGVTIGGRRTEFDCPTIGDGVQLGAGSTILGSINLGANARIGAGAVVLSDVPPGSLVVGNPGKVVTGRVADERSDNAFPHGSSGDTQ